MPHGTTQIGSSTVIRNAVWGNTTLTSISVKCLPASDLHNVVECVARNRLLTAAAQALKQIAPIEDSDGFDSLRERTLRMKVMECFLPTAAAAQVCRSIPMRSTGVAATLQFVLDQPYLALGNHKINNSAIINIDG